MCRLLHFLITTPTRSQATTPNDPLVVSEEVQHTAQQLFDDVQAKAGSAAVLREFAAERARVVAKRQDRKKQRSLNLLLDPQGAAVRKTKKNKNKRKAKKDHLAAWKGPQTNKRRYEAPVE